MTIFFSSYADWESEMHSVNACGGWFCHGGRVVGWGGWKVVQGKELQWVILTWCSTGSQRTFSRSRSKGIGQRIRKESPQQALGVSVAGNRNCGGHGNKGGTSWTRSWGQWSEAWLGKQPEEELEKSWAQLGMFLRSPIFLPSADKKTKWPILPQSSSVENAGVHCSLLTVISVLN